MTSPAEFMSNGDGELTGEIVPFGKYKGRPVAELAADDGYRDWVLSQPWVREKYVNFYNILIQGGPPPQDSPEHNEMQARFLDENWCIRLMRNHPDVPAGDGLAVALDKVVTWKEKNQGATESYEIVPASARNIEPEYKGWDIFFAYQLAGIRQEWTCECDIRYDFTPPDPSDWRSEIKAWREDKFKPGSSEWSRRRLLDGTDCCYFRDTCSSQHIEEAEYPRIRHYALDHSIHENYFGKTLAGAYDPTTGDRHSFRVAAELKPDLGDDYPSVLRQVKGYKTERMVHPQSRGQYIDMPTCDAVFVVARRAQFRSVTWEQVRQVFAASGIILIRESDI